MMAGASCVGWALVPFSAMGCGLDWTLPHAHFEGVEEHGYVIHWEKIGEVAVSGKVVIPVNIGLIRIARRIRRRWARAGSWRCWNRTSSRSTRTA